ncbi:MAG: PAS-domain containing protein [Alphaproteobacteria bacterium]|nr:PAS-domain containing protein [Alphaproteobacteria bacterium]
MDIDGVLRDAVGSMQEAFALFDAEDCLVFCNEAYTNMHPLGREFIQPGVRFEDIIHTNVESGNVADAFGREEDYIRERLDQHRNPKGPLYRRLASGKTFIINESRTPDGGTLFTSTEVTDLKQIEEDLREKEALTRRMLEASPVGVLIVTREGKHLFANERSLEIQGVTRDELFASNAESYYADPDERKRLKEGLYETGFTPPTEVELIKPNGTHYFVILTSTLLEFEGQKAHLTYLYDITERKRIEDALRESEQRLSDAVESILDGVALFDAEDKFVFCNTAFRENLENLDDVLVPGTSFEDIARAAGERIHNINDPDGMEKYVQRRLREHEKRESSVRYYPETDNFVIVQEYETSGGGTFLVRSDITELKHAETALRESEARLRDIAESASDHFWEMGPDLRFTSVSERFLKENELPREDIIGKTRFEFVGPETIMENPGPWNRHQEDLENRRPFRNFEFSLKLPDGKTRQITISGKPAFDQDGTFLGYRGASTDISAYRRAQNELTHHNKMESLGHMAGGIAHNLNNMLQPILILGKLVKDRLDEESQEHRNMDVICQAASGAKELVQRISTFSRQQGLIRNRADMYHIIREGLDLVASTIPSSITVRENLDAQTGQVYVDTAQIQTVLMNLVSNAVDDMDGKAGELSVSLSRITLNETAESPVPGLDAGIFAKLTVTDTGHGMDPETLEKIFDPFFTTKGVGQGTGLGLSSAFGIIQKHAGTIHVKSEAGHGATFEVYLPLDQSVKD